MYQLLTCVLERTQVVCRVSEWPLPVIAKRNATADWITSVNKLLHWNVRERQKKMTPKL